MAPFSISPALRAEMRAILALAWPIQATNLMDFGLSMVLLMVVGRLGPIELGAAALGNLYVNFVGMAPLFGMAAAIDTLSSQACGALAYPRVGQVSQRAALILTLMTLPIAAGWWFAGAAFSALDQEPEPTELATRYVRWMLVGLLPVTWHEVLKRHLQAVGLVSPPAAIAAVAIVFNAALAAWLVHGTSVGFVGAPIAMGLSRWLQLGLLLWYHRRHRQIHAGLEAWGLGRPAVAAVPASAPLPIRSSGAAVDETETGRLPDALTSISIDCAPLDSGALDVSGGAGVAHAGGGGGGASAASAGASSPSSSSDGAQAAAQAGAPASAPVSTVAQPPRPDKAGLPLEAPLRLTAHDLLDATWAAGLDWPAATSGWGEFLSLGGPSSLMLLVEWGSFEVQALIAGAFSTAVLAAHTVLAITAGANFMFILGFSIAGGIRVGQRMGENDAPAAQLALRATLLLGGAFTLGNALCVLCATPFWARVFTDDAAVGALVTAWLPLLAIFALPDMIQGVTCGALRGLGFPGLAAGSNVLSYVVIGLPTAWGLCVRAGLGLPGLWAGGTLGFTVSAVATSAAAASINWRKAAAGAHARALAAPPPPPALAATGVGGGVAAGAAGGGVRDA